jgi:GT2 family glycosyltransferase
MSFASIHNDNPLISIIIVTWNCRDYVLCCLETIYKNRDVCVEVIVRDNGSVDGTQQAIQEKYPQVKLTGDSQNVGFAAANNEAIKQATGQYLLLLNPDTELFPTTLMQFIKVTEAYGDKTMIVPTLLNSDGTLQPSRHSFPTLSGLGRKSLAELKRILGRPTANQELRVDWAIGACWFMPTTVFQSIGELDTNYFMYGEDLDYCWQTHRAGFEIIWAPEIQVIHHGNVSGRQKWGDQRLLKTYQVTVYFWMKHLSLFHIIAMMLITMLHILIETMFAFIRAIISVFISQASRKRQPVSYRERLWRGVVFVQACLDRNAWHRYLSTQRHD